MAKQEAFGARVDLKQFFEASVGALQNMNGSRQVANQAIRHHRALTERPRMDVTQTNRALTDAARALTALWKA
jgi:lipopolysaccharide biosynthesis regulator YciM